jgi:ferric-dicitrate binding protein FerR (iron transport regulator)
MEQSRFQHLFRKLAERSTTTEEKEEMRLYLKENTDEVFPFPQWQETSAHGRLSSSLINNILNTIQGVPLIKMGKARHVRMLRQTVAAAAVIMIAIGVYRLQQSIPSGNKTATIVSTAWGEQKKATLPDGSTIHLNGGSTIQLTDDFNKNNRTVKLTGEAYFEVQQAAGLPFIVQSGSLNTMVLGTAFNIATTENEIHVSVKSGSVKLAVGNQSEILKGGMTASWDSTRTRLVIATMSAENVGSWENNRMVFRNTTLKDICLSLERRHGVHFEMKDNSISECRYSTVFDKLTLQASLDKLALLGNLQFLQKDSTIIIKGSPCRK